MRIAAIGARGFRNLNGRFPLAAPLAVLVGENNTGKSNVVDACRLLFEPEAGPHARRWITADDFAHDDTGDHVADSFELEAELVDLDESEQARLVTCLAPSVGPGCARLRMQARLRSDGRVDAEWFGGDADHPDIERWAREAITFTYLHPLRDAATDLRPGRDNRLVTLLRSLAPNGHPDRVEVEQIAQEANAAMQAVGVLQIAKTRIQDRLDGLAGRGRLGQRSDLAFAEPRFDRAVGALRALAGTASPLEIRENGLGYNNLLYMAVLLSALAEQSDAALRVLLVEEPEAHLHPQLQDLLMRYLESETSAGTQVIVTSHSPNFASAARVERLTVMTRESPDAPVVARMPAAFGITDIQLAHLRRFLDVTKAALLFARGVILVEGVAEQLLIPAIAQQMGRPLSRSGVAVINIGGVAFPPFTELFGSDRLPYRCAVISDADPGTDGDEEGADPALSARAAALASRERDNLLVRLAERTLEWDIVAAGNWDVAISALTPIKPRVAAALATQHEHSDSRARAEAVLAKVEDVKGRFAQELVGLLESGQEMNVPTYLAEAIRWVTSDQDAAGASTSRDA